MVDETNFDTKSTSTNPLISPVVSFTLHSSSVLHFSVFYLCFPPSSNPHATVANMRAASRPPAPPFAGTRAASAELSGGAVSLCSPWEGIAGWRQRRPSPVSVGWRC